MNEDALLRRGFRYAMVGVVILFVLLGGLLAAFGSRADRPEGVAERWLSDLGDTRRDGVKEKATQHAAKAGPVSLGAALLPKGSTNGRAAFLDLEVGKAQDAVAVAVTLGDRRTVVPYRLHQRLGNDTGPAIEGDITLDRFGDRWRIASVTTTRGIGRVPSEGGPPAAKAPAGLYAATLAVGLVLAIACGFLVRLAGREAERARSTTAAT